MSFVVSFLICFGFSESEEELLATAAAVVAAGAYIADPMIAIPTIATTTLVPIKIAFLFFLKNFDTFFAHCLIFSAVFLTAFLNVFAVFLTMFFFATNC